MLLLVHAALAAEPSAAVRCFPELQACYEDGQETQLALNLCSHRASRICEAEREAVTARVGWRGDEARFDAAVAAWQTYRQKRCDLRASAWEGGSGQPMIYHHCWAEMDMARKEELMRLVRPANTPDLAAADAKLNALWKQVYKDAKPLLEVQRAWLAYRDAECAWEATLPGGEAKKDACLASLTATRNVQLAEDGEEP